MELCYCFKSYPTISIPLTLQLALAIAYELSLNCGQLLFEAGKVLVECPHKGLVGPEGRLRAFLWAVGGTGAWWARLRAVSRHLVYEPLQPEHGLPIHSNVLQYRAQTVLQHRQRKECVSYNRKTMHLLKYNKETFPGFKLTLVRCVTTTLFLTDTFPSCCWNIKCFLTPERSLQHNSQRYKKTWLLIKWEIFVSLYNKHSHTPSHHYILPQRLPYYLSLCNKGLFFWQIQRISVIQVLIPKKRDSE